MADAAVSKTVELITHVGSTPTPGTYALFEDNLWLFGDSFGPPSCLSSDKSDYRP